MLGEWIGALRALGALAVDVAEAIIFNGRTNRAAENLWARETDHVSERALLHEIAEHLGAVRGLIEDTRNLIQQQATISMNGCTCGDFDRASGQHLLYCPLWIGTPTK